MKLAAAATLAQMKTAELIKEHSRLVQVLRDGTKQEQRKEASKQAAELQEYKKGKV